MLDTVKINHVQHISFTQSRLTDAVSVILSELLSYEHPSKSAGCLRSIFGSARTLSYCGRTRWAMSGSPSVWSHSMWIPVVGLSQRKISAGSVWRALGWMSCILPTTTTVWRMPIHWSAQRSAGAGIPSWISSRSLPIFAKRFSRKRTNAKACRLPHEGKSAGSVYWQNQSRPGTVAGIGKIRWARPIFLPLTGSAGSAMSSD